IPGATYRGKKLEFSAFMLAQGGATAVLGVLSFIGDRPQNLVTVTQPSSGSSWSEQRGVYNVPDDPNVQLVIACSVSGKSGTVWFDDVSLVPSGDLPPAAALPAAKPGPAGTPVPVSNSSLRATIDLDAANVLRQIPRTLYGANLEWVWNAYG